MYGGGGGGYRRGFGGFGNGLHGPGYGGFGGRGGRRERIEDLENFMRGFPIPGVVRTPHDWTNAGFTNVDDQGRRNFRAIFSVTLLDDQGSMRLSPGHIVWDSLTLAATLALKVHSLPAGRNALKELARRVDESSYRYLGQGGMDMDRLVSGFIHSLKTRFLPIYVTDIRMEQALAWCNNRCIGINKELFARALCRSKERRQTQLYNNIMFFLVGVVVHELGHAFIHYMKATLQYPHRPPTPRGTSGYAHQPERGEAGRYMTICTFGGVFTSPGIYGGTNDWHELSLTRYAPDGVREIASIPVSNDTINDLIVNRNFVLPTPAGHHHGFWAHAHPRARMHQCTDAPTNINFPDPDWYPMLAQAPFMRRETGSQQQAQGHSPQSSDIPAVLRYAAQLDQLASMGFSDIERNINVLRESDDDVQGALEKLLSSP